MLYKYKDIFAILKSDYNIKKEIKKGTLFKFNNGLYGDKQHYSKIEEIVTLFPNAILDGYTALFYLGISSIDSEIIYVSSKVNSTRIHDPHVKQIFKDKNTIFEGVILQVINGCEVKIYDREKMLIHVIKNRNKIKAGIYKDIVNSYRKISNELNKIKLANYLEHEVNKKHIYEILNREFL
ncbi:MAG: hypothetical protein RSA18_01545 [Bacilli bacterium]